MEKITVINYVKEDSDLLQFEVRSALSRLLDVPAEQVFPLPEGTEVVISLSLEARKPPFRGII